MVQEPNQKYPNGSLHLEEEKKAKLAIKRNEKKNIKMITHSLKCKKTSANNDVKQMIKLYFW